jgi:hypothetical protein
MTTATRSRLKPLLVSAYWAANTPNEFRLVCLMWALCGLGDPMRASTIVPRIGQCAA